EGDLSPRAEREQPTSPFFSSSLCGSSYLLFYLFIRPIVRTAEEPEPFHLPLPLLGALHSNEASKERPLSPPPLLLLIRVERKDRIEFKPGALRRNRPAHHRHR